MTESQADSEIRRETEELMAAKKKRKEEEKKMEESKKTLLEKHNEMVREIGIFKFFINFHILNFNQFV